MRIWDKILHKLAGVEYKTEAQLREERIEHNIMVLTHVIDVERAERKRVMKELRKLRKDMRVIEVAVRYLSKTLDYTREDLDKPLRKYKNAIEHLDLTLSYNNKIVDDFRKKYEDLYYSPNPGPGFAEATSSFQTALDTFYGDISNKCPPSDNQANVSSGLYDT